MKKLNVAIGLIGVAVAAVAAEVQPMNAIYTVPHELDCLVKAGHIQGACCS